MCGIIGIVSNKNCVNSLIEGLEKLAYRGYDSAGLATLIDGKILKRVALGKIEGGYYTVQAHDDQDEAISRPIRYETIAAP